jgi:hypothetical protein
VKKGIIFYTDNRLDEKIASMCRNQLLKAELPITSVSLKPLDFGKNIVLPLERGYETYFKQIITALKNLDADVVFYCEHDVLYHPSHFEFTPERNDTFYYNLNVFRWKYGTDKGVMWDANQVAELCCDRLLALDWYKKKLETYYIKFDRSFEPEDKYENWRSSEPNIDIRHGKNLTKSKWSINDFRDKSTCINWQEGKVPEWAKEIIK